MPWVDELSERSKLKRCIRDLVALSTLPTIWKDCDPRQIAESVAAALLPMLNVDVVYVAVPEARNEPAAGVIRTKQTMTLGPSGRIERVLRGASIGRSDQIFTINNPIGEGTLRVTAAPIGIGGDALIVVGSVNPDFPSETHRLLLGIAANDAKIALQCWHAEAERRHFNESLEQRVTLRTSELEDALHRLTFEATERARADARAQELQLELLHSSRLSAAGQMAGALAHELSQPLTAFTNSVNAGRRMMANGGHRRIDTVRAVLEEAADQAIRAGEIIRRLREFVTRGETEKRIESLPTLIREASDLTSAGTGAHGVQVRLHFDPRAESVLVSRIQLQQVMVNLMRNAHEAMAQSARRELDVDTVLHDDETIEITIADSGPGLLDEIADHVFEPFHTTKRDGMGLGLSICRSIVEAHRGKMRYQPNRGGGAMFRVTLPARLHR